MSESGENRGFEDAKSLNAQNAIFIVTMTQIQKLTACTWWSSPVESRDEDLDHKTSANF